MSTAEQPKYSRAEISDESKRKKTAEEIKATNSGVDKKKTPEGKKELSQTWVQKANLTPAQKEALCDELLVKDIDSEDPKELERRVIALQKHLGFPAKDCDGILGWKTLEKTDKMIEEQHKTGDEETGEKDESGAYGFDRVAHQEAKKIEEEKTFQKDMNQLAAELKDGNGIEDDRLPKGVGVDQDKQVLVKTDDKTQFWDANKDGGSWNSRAESLNNEQNIAIIKDVLSKLDTFEEGQKYVKSLGTSTAYTEKEMNEFNAILKGKGWELKMDDQGEFQEYALVNVNKIEPALAETESGINEIKSVIEKGYSKDFKGLQKALTELGITSATISGKKLQTITLGDMLSAVTSTGKVGEKGGEMLLNHFLGVHIRNGVIEAGKQVGDSAIKEVRDTAQGDINKQIEISQKFSTIIEKGGDATLGEIFDAGLTQIDGTVRLSTAPVRYAVAPIKGFFKKISSWFSGK